jgi:hypothetical protein
MLTACHLCGDLLQPIRNRVTKTLSGILGCAHCDNPCRVGPRKGCKPCRRADKASA